MEYPKFYKHNTVGERGFFTAIMGELESIKVCTYKDFPAIEAFTFTNRLPSSDETWVEITPEEFNQAMGIASALIAEQIDKLAQMCVNQEIKAIQPLPCADNTESSERKQGSEQVDEIPS